MVDMFSALAENKKLKAENAAKDKRIAELEIKLMNTDACSGFFAKQLNKNKELLSDALAENAALREACECVVFDSKSQDQGPVNKRFLVICDTTLEECKQALQRKED